MKKWFESCWLYNRKYGHLLVFILMFSKAEAQVLNLVIDPSFEDTIAPISLLGDSSLRFWTNLDSTSITKLGFAYFHKSNPIASGIGLPFNYHFYQEPRSGNGVIDLLVYRLGAPLNETHRAYARNKLKSNLIFGKSYCVKIYISPFDKQGDFYTDGIQLYFDNGQLDTIVALDSSGIYPFVQPQVSNPAGNILNDTANWTLISGIFTATGTERFLTIGNFKDYSDIDTIRTPFYSNLPDGWSDLILDDVSVIPIDASNWLQDVWCVLGDSAYIGLPRYDAPDAEWYTINMQYIGKGGGIKVLPTQPVTQYIQSVDVCNTVLYDTLTVYATPMGVVNVQDGSGVFVFPNPGDGELNVSCSFCDNNTIIGIFTIDGKKVYTKNLKYNSGDKSIQTQLIPGIYLLTIENTDTHEKRTKKITMY